LDGVIEGLQVVEAPLNGRNVNNLLDFLPGVVPGGGTQGSTMATRKRQLQSRGTDSGDCLRKLSDWRAFSGRACSSLTAPGQISLKTT